VIGGKHNTVQGNNIVRSANAGIMQWHSLDCRIVGNSLYDCNRLVHNGVGAAAGDAYGAIVIDGNSNIGAGTYMSVVQNNSMVACNQGGAGAIYGINIKASAYPQASNKVVIDGNHTDATVKSANANSIPEIATAAGGITSVVQLNDVTSAGSGAIITGAERTAIGANTTAIATLDSNLTLGAVTDNNRVVLSQDIKSYGDTNWASGGTSDIFIKNGETATPDASFTGTIFWNKTDYYNQGGGQGDITLPITPTDGQAFIIQSLNPYNSTGQISVNIPANSSSTGWDGRTWFNVDDVAYYPVNQTLKILLTNTGRARYVCIYHITSTVEKRWFLCELRDPRLTPAMISTIESSHHTFFFKHFNNNEANYALAHANGAAAYYQIPNGHRKYQIIYGDGLETTLANVYGLRVMLPYDNLQDGDRVTLHTAHHFAHSNANYVMFIHWGTQNGCPGARVMNEYGVSTTATVGMDRVETQAHTLHRFESHFHYVESLDAWIHRKDSY